MFTREIALSLMALSSALPVQSVVILQVYNVLGQKVATLISNTVMDIGRREVDFNGINLPSAAYFYRLDVKTASDPAQIFTRVKKMELVK